MNIIRGGQRSFQLERHSRSRPKHKIGAALPLPLHISKWSGSAAPASGASSAAPLPLLLNKKPLYMLQKLKFIIFTN